jgi:hypothetical protein
MGFCYIKIRFYLLCRVVDLKMYFWHLLVDFFAEFYGKIIFS